MLLDCTHLLVRKGNGCRAGFVDTTALTEVDLCSRYFWMSSIIRALTPSTDLVILCLGK